jgi:hypothetical protein
MSFVKKSPIIFSGVVAFLAIIIIVGVSILSRNNKQAEEYLQSPNSSGPLSSENYQAEARDTVQLYELFLKGEKSFEEITIKKDHLLSVKVSREYQDLHLRLVMLADSLQTDHNDKSPSSTPENVLSALYLEYPWLKK